MAALTAAESQPHCAHDKRSRFGRASDLRELGIVGGGGAGGVVCDAGVSDTCKF